MTFNVNPISQFPPGTAVLATDIYLATDTQDRTSSPAGTTYKYTIQQLQNYLSVDQGSNLIYIDATIGSAFLAAGGSVDIYVASTVTSQYKIREIYMNTGGTNFSGGGGDRNLIVTDNITTYTTVPAASLQSLTNTRWGNSGVPFPTGPLYTPTAAGRNLVAMYQGGTTDYTVGSITLSIMLQRVDLG